MSAVYEGCYSYPDHYFVGMPEIKFVKKGYKEWLKASNKEESTETYIEYLERELLICQNDYFAECEKEAGEAI